MKRAEPTPEDVKRANRAVYEAKDFDAYERNPSIFDPVRQREIAEILASLSSETEQGKILDIGCGTGNVLRLAEGRFEARYGLDIAAPLLARMASREAEGDPLYLACGDGEALPFADESFDTITCYGLLHHLMDPLPTLREAFRVLRSGGRIYTDHDPNIHLGRFYHPFYRWKYRKEPGFGSDVEELAEYHHSRTGGLDPEALARGLEEIGFEGVEVRYRMTRSEALPAPIKAIRLVLNLLSRVYPARSFYSHFVLLARRPDGKSPA